VADTIDVDELAARLYSSAPEDFVKARGEGAKRLKAAGHQDAAADFAKLAKPSVPAWAVNLLATQRSDVIDDVVRHGEELRDAHTGGGGAKRIRAAHQARQDAIRSATDVAVELTGRQVSETHRGEIASTLEAASSDPAVASEVRGAQLVRPLEAPTGFGTLDRLTVIPGGKASRRQTKESTDDDDDAEETAIQARASMLRADADAALGDAEAAAEAVAALRGQVATLEERRNEVHEELERLDDELTTNRRQLRDAERAALAAARKATRAASRADRAES
jgi:flagellin-like hook-associated protein FlgL